MTSRPDAACPVCGGAKWIPVDFPTDDKPITVCALPKGSTPRPIRGPVRFFGETGRLGIDCPLCNEVFRTAAEEIPAPDLDGSETE